MVTIPPILPICGDLDDTFLLFCPHYMGCIHIYIYRGFHSHGAMGVPPIAPKKRLLVSGKILYPQHGKSQNKIWMITEGTPMT